MVDSYTNIFRGIIMTVQEMIKELVHMPMGAEVTAFDPDVGEFVPVRAFVWSPKNVEIQTNSED